MAKLYGKQDLVKVCGDATLILPYMSKVQQSGRKKRMRWSKPEKKTYRKSEINWATSFIENIICITHDQWTCWQNEKLHYRRHLGAESKFVYEQIMNQILSKMEMKDPEDLLPEDHYILGVDSEEIAKTTPDGRQAWLANFETAVAAAGHAKRSGDELDDRDDEDGEELSSNPLRPPQDRFGKIIRDGKEWRNNKFVARESIGGNNTTSSANTKLKITYQMTLKMNLI